MNHLLWHPISKAFIGSSAFFIKGDYESELKNIKTIRVVAQNAGKYNVKSVGFVEPNQTAIEVSPNPIVEGAGGKLRGMRCPPRPHTLKKPGRT